MHSESCTIVEFEIIDCTQSRVGIPEINYQT